MFTVLIFILSYPVDNYTADPYIIFEQSDSALSSINTIEYSFTFSGTGTLSNIIPALEGMTSLGFLPETDHPLMYHSLESMIKEGAIRNITVPSSFVASVDSVYFVDHDKSLVYTAEYNNTAHDMFDFPPASVMMEYVVSSPFMDEILADSIAVLFPVELNGVPCHVFHVFYDDNERTEAVWFLSMNDLLPRAVERISYYGPTSAPGGQLLEISNLNFNCPVPSSALLPDNYTAVPWLSLLEPSTQAPSFFLADKDGFARRSSDFGDRTLLLCFFASWDPSSISALGLLKSMTDEYPDFVQAVGISILENTDPWFRLNSLGINFPVLVFGEDAAEDYNVHSVPAIFLISGNREVLYSSQTVTDETVSEIRRLIEENI